jgi:uncharacterized protein YjbI with pentapeptide repeats
MIHASGYGKGAVDAHSIDREFTGATFRDEYDGDLTRLRTARAVFTDCDFSGVTLTESEHSGSALGNCAFRHTSLVHSTFRDCTLLESVFAECLMRSRIGSLTRFR